MEPDWNGIRHFTALVEKETLTAAAEHLGVQHSTVARQIARLETALGLRLFDRIGKRYLLTADGERLHRHACEICRDMNMLQHAAREQAALRHNVAISAPPFVARLLLMPHLAAFCRRHADIRLHLLAKAALADLHERRADIALRLVRPTQNDLVVRRLRGFSYRLYGHESYLKNTRREHWQYVQIAVETRFARWFAEQIGEEADITFASNDFAAVKQAVCGQIGIGILPNFAVSPADGLQTVALTDGDPPPAFAAEICLVMHEDVRRSPGVRAAADFIGKVLAGE